MCERTTHAGAGSADAFAPRRNASGNTGAATDITADAIQGPHGATSGNHAGPRSRFAVGAGAPHQIE